jgi:ankyrin repeat protein
LKKATMSKEAVGKSARRVSMLVLLAGLLRILISGGGLLAQTGGPPLPADTSYFKPGENDWNLVESVLRSDPGSVLLLLKRGADPNTRAEGGMTALMYAAERGDTLIVKLLVLNGADPDLTHIENTPPLMVSVLNRQFDAAHLLLRYGADPNHRDDYGGTSLIYAAAMNDYAMVDLLLYFGATDSLRDREGNDALMVAAGMGHLEATDVLLQNGIPPDTRDKNSNTPLMIASQQGNTEMISLLLEHHAEMGLVNDQHYTALAHAVRTGELDAARILLDSGSNVHHVIRKGQNLYDLAVEHKHREIRNLLESRGAARTPQPDFSEVGIGWGNSFGKEEYMMQGRIWWQDRRYGFFIETGYDVRPFTWTIQVQENDTLVYQYRENRSAWIHGAGKYFTIGNDKTNFDYGFYAGIYGMLSFPKYSGIADRPPAEYNLIPSAGIFFRGELAGIKAGIERYGFGTLHEGNWKATIVLYARFHYKKSSYEYKEFGY